MSSYSIISNGTIINRIVLDNPSDWEAPAGCTIINDSAAPLAIGGSYLNGVYVAPVQQTNAIPPPPPSILSQDLMAQFTADDAAKIQTAIAGNVQFWLLWQSLTTQKDPMLITNARFVAGWSALVSVLGQSRMDAIATALGVTIA